MRRLNLTLFLICALSVIGVGFGVHNEYYLGVATLMMINALNTAAFNMLLDTAVSSPWGRPPFTVSAHMLLPFCLCTMACIR